MADKYAIIEDGEVVNVTLADPQHAEEKGLVACPDHVGPGWLHDGSTFSPPPPPPIETLRQMAFATLANERWRRETGGIEVGGMAVRTDDKTQARLTAAQSAFDKGLITSVDWKLGDQAWVTLTEAELDQIVAAVTAHVAACFAAENVVSDQIGAIPDVDALTALDLTAAFEAEYQAEMAV